MEGQNVMVLWFSFGGAAMLALAAIWMFRRRTAYLGPVKEELKKEKQWLRRGEYSAAMVKGRQNLELLLKLTAEVNGIQIDNTAPDVGNGNRNGRYDKRGGGRGRKRSLVMTNQEFCRYLGDEGYLDRVARWELNQVRIIGNKAVHENFASKDEAWNQFQYLEDLVKLIGERSANPGQRKSQQRKERDGRNRQNDRNRYLPSDQKKAGGPEKPQNQNKPAGKNDQPGKAGQKKKKGQQDQAESKKKDVQKNQTESKKKDVQKNQAESKKKDVQKNRAESKKKNGQDNNQGKQPQVKQGQEKQAQAKYQLENQSQA